MNKLKKIFLVLLIIISNCTSVFALCVDKGSEKDTIVKKNITLLEKDNANNIENNTFELLGKTFKGTSTGELTIKFYSEEYNSTQDTCMEVNDRGDISYIYFSYSMYNKDTHSLEQLTSAVRGYWKDYGPLSIKCIWDGEMLNVKILMSNGMTLVYSDDCKLDGGTILPIEPIGPDEKDKAKITIDPINIIVGKRKHFEGKYIPKSPSNIKNELDSIKWSVEDASIAELNKVSYIIADDKESAILNFDIIGKKHGETSITGSLLNIEADSNTAIISVEPELILPVNNVSFINDYDCNIYIAKKDYICVKVSMKEADKEYLEKFLSNIKYEIYKNPDSSNENIAEIVNTGYIISDDGKEGEFIIDIDSGITSLDNIVIINTAAQSKSIRLIYNSLYIDADQDGIPDEWEENGLDTDKDGLIDVDLKAMGAVVGQKDLFVEIDKMDKLNISQKSLNMVAEQFKKHNINLHIDAGSNSIDYVTGEKWGSLSKSDTMPYEKLTTLYETYKDEKGKEHYKNFNGWDELSNKYFSNERRAIFRHCMLINSFDTDRTSGIARGIPEQSFVISSYGFGNEDNNSERAMAGTLMHELGHTLGLCHGGSDHTSYKPNNLSIMNYLYQFSGLYGTQEINYSEYELPAINEKEINELKGIDPNNVIDNPNLGAKWILKNKKEKEYHIENVVGKSIDFNNNGKIEPLANISFYHDTNEDIIFNTPSINEWNALLYTGGSIGNMGATSPLSKIVTDKNKVVFENISVEKAKELGVYENKYDDEGSHVITKVDRIEPTCTNNGNIEYYICNDCHKIFQDENCKIEITNLPTVIPALGHDYREWKVTKEPTCTEKGNQERTCSMCAKKETKSIPAFGHDYGKWKVIKESTDKEEGFKERICINCGEKEVMDIKKIRLDSLHKLNETDNKRNELLIEKGNKNVIVKTSDALNVYSYMLSSIITIIIIVTLYCSKKRIQM